MAARLRVIKKVENITSDINFLEECVRTGKVPNGIRWKFKAQGLGEEENERIETIKKDAIFRIMDVMVKGLKEKGDRLERQKEEMIEEGWRNKNGWDKVKWIREVDDWQRKFRKEAEERKRRKREKMDRQNQEGEGGYQEGKVWRKGAEQEESINGRRTCRDIEEEGEEEGVAEVVDSWEMLVEGDGTEEKEDTWMDLGRKIYDKEESILGKEEELKGIKKILEKGRVEVGYKTPMDGNCFFHAVGQQVGMSHKEVRMEAVEFLRSNRLICGEEWSGFIVGGERGKRLYLRTMGNEGEWTDHVMIMATARAMKRRIIIYSQTEKTTINPEEEEGEEILLGFIRELHYFGVKRKDMEERDDQRQRTNQKDRKQQGKGEKKEKDGAVFNLGVEGLTEDMEDVLSLGLKFVPLQRVNKSKVEADVERLKIRLMWDVYWKWVSEEERQAEDTPGEESEDREQREAERQKERMFEGKTEKTPNGLPNRWKVAIEKYGEAIKEDIFGGLRRNPKDNMSTGGRKALAELQEKVRRKEWAIRPADKGGGITVEEYDGLREDGFQELADNTTFERRDKPGLEKISKEVEDKLKDMRERGMITKKMREYMSAKNKKEGIMKINRKVHKKTKENGRHPSRVYISGIGTPTEGIAGLVEKELQEGVESQASYIQDTADFLRRLEGVEKLQGDEFMFTMDVVALYPSVPREKTREAMRENLDKRKLKKIPTEELLELGDMVLRSNEFTFEGERYLQKEGTAIGSKMGKNYACAFMGAWETEVQEKAEKELGKKPRMWLRFVDDIWGIWKGTEEELRRFVDLANGHEERIKVTYEVCKEAAVFLDVKVSKRQDGTLKTELYIKPTDRTRYLHQGSDHPRHTKEGIAKGQFRRLRRICSEDEDYWKYGKMVEKKLVSRGYGSNQVRQQMKEAHKMERQEALERVKKRDDRKINFVITHSGYLPNVNNILKRHKHYLEEDGLGSYIKELPRLSLRRGKNIGDLVVNAKAKKESLGSGPCGKRCKLCEHMWATRTIKDKEGKEMELRAKIDCKTVGVIYGMYCRKCEKIVYVGKTKNKLGERFNGHRADLKTGDDSKPAFHYKKDGHQESDMMVVGLENVPGMDDVYRVTRERWWMNRLGTLDEENRKR